MNNKNYKTPDQILHDLSGLYIKKGIAYGNTYDQFGKVMSALIPSGIELKYPQEFNEYALFHMLVHKITRLANTMFARKYIESSIESLDDLSCYAAILSSVLSKQINQKENATDEQPK